MGTLKCCVYYFGQDHLVCGVINSYVSFLLVVILFDFPIFYQLSCLQNASCVHIWECYYLVFLIDSQKTPRTPFSHSTYLVFVFPCVLCTLSHTSALILTRLYPFTPVCTPLHPLAPVIKSIYVYSRNS